MTAEKMVSKGCLLLVCLGPIPSNGTFDQILNIGAEKKTIFYGVDKIDCCHFFHIYIQLILTLFFL